MTNHVLFILLCRRVCEILLFLLRVKMTKCQRDGKDMTKCHTPPSPLSTLSFMELLYFAPTERLISLAHATNLHRPDDDLVSNF